MEKIKFKALTFDDVLLIPRYTNFMPSEAQLETRVSKNISLKIPLISAAMDTVTEAAMAIALAENGGIGIIHKNNSIEEQVLEVKTVKKYESGVVRDPTTIKSTKTINELMQLTTELSISGMPVVDDGKLMGIVTRRDFRYADNLSEFVSSIMTPREKLITVAEGFNQDEVKKLMYNNRIEKILVTDEQGALTGLVTMKDIDKSAEHPLATKDLSGSLQVGAALGTGADTMERATALCDAGVDLFVIDSAHGHSKNVIETQLKSDFNVIDSSSTDLNQIQFTSLSKLEYSTQHHSKNFSADLKERHNNSLMVDKSAYFGVLIHKLLRDLFDVGPWDMTFLNYFILKNKLKSTCSPAQLEQVKSHFSTCLHSNFLQSISRFPLEFEKEFSIFYNQKIIRGRYDCLVQRKEDIVIIDFKTESFKDKLEQDIIEKYQLQTDIYLKAAKQQFKTSIKPIKLIFYSTCDDAFISIKG